MSIIKRGGGKPGSGNGKKLLVVGWDGVPFSLVERMISEGGLKSLSRVSSSGSIRKMNSVIPTVSGAAWASFMTGMDPSGHGIYGFIEREPNSYDIYIPNAANLKARTVFDYLSEAGKRVVVLNVPVTYPPQEVNGILVSGFLAPDLKRGTYPPEVADKLEQIGYVIDVDSWQARDDRDGFLSSLENALAKRLEAALHFMETEEWDFFMVHFMDTDRLNHFFWKDFVEGHPTYADAFQSFYKKLDDALGKLVDAAARKGDTDVIVLSDHGFTSIKSEVNLTAYLENEGYLQFKSQTPEDLNDMSPSSRAYSLIPGRIYLNLKGREPHGSVTEGGQSKKLLEELKQRLMELTSPETGDRVIEQVLTRDELYKGPDLNEAPDMVAVPALGYDLKAGIGLKDVFSTGHIQGMHTFDDAFIATNAGEIDDSGTLNITDLMPAILEFFGLPIPEAPSLRL